MRSAGAARTVRSLGTGAAIGLGSIVYTLTVLSRCLQEKDLLSDACAAAELFTEDLIRADRQLDVLGGNAGAILGLLRLYRETRSTSVLDRATICGEHLLSQSRLGAQGCRSWPSLNSRTEPLNGMAHGAAGFAYALSALAGETGREDFAQAASEAVAFENYSYNSESSNWPDLRVPGKLSWPSQWCHGASGIGLARIGMKRFGIHNSERVISDIQNAIRGAEQVWPNKVDTLCCGTLGSIEFFREAATALSRADLQEIASQRLIAIISTATSTGDYRWNAGKRRFNLGLFRGLAGIGYTSLRQVERCLPNVLIWE